MDATNRIHFVISAPRSGSTWLARALGFHPAIHATEHRLFGDFLEVWPNNDGSASARLTVDHFCKLFSAHYFHESLGTDQHNLQRQLQEALHGMLIQFALGKTRKQLVVDKITPYAGTSELVMRSIEQFFPAAKIIQLLRDPRDVLVSGVFDWIQREPRSSRRRRLFVDKDRSVRLARLLDDDTIQTWARYWEEPMLAVEGCRGVAQVRYEAMIRDQASELRRLFEYLCVDPDPAHACAKAASFRATTGRAPGQDAPLAKARKGIVGDWRQHLTRRDARLIHDLIGETMIRHGYAESEAWIETLPNKLALRAA